MAASRRNPAKTSGSQLAGLGFELVGERRVSPGQPRQPRRPEARLTGIALNFAERNRVLRDPAVGEEAGVPGILPALVDQTLRRAGAELEVAVPIGVAVFLHPSLGRPGRRLQALRKLQVPSPALVLVEEDQEQRRGVVGAVGERVRDLAQAAQLATAELVQDLARLGVAEVVELGGLKVGQGFRRSQRRRGWKGSAW